MRRKSTQHSAAGCGQRLQSVSCEVVPGGYQRVTNIPCWTKASINGFEVEVSGKKGRLMHVPPKGIVVSMSTAIMTSIFFLFRPSSGRTSPDVSLVNMEAIETAKAIE